MYLKRCVFNIGIKLIYFEEKKLIKCYDMVDIKVFVWVVGFDWNNCDFK